MQHVDLRVIGKEKPSHHQCHEISARMIPLLRGKVLQLIVASTYEGSPSGFLPMPKETNQFFCDFVTIAGHGHGVRKSNISFGPWRCAMFIPCLICYNVDLCTFHQVDARWSAFSVFLFAGWFKSSVAVVYALTFTNGATCPKRLIFLWGETTCRTLWRHIPTKISYTRMQLLVSVNVEQVCIHPGLGSSLSTQL